MTIRKAVQTDLDALAKVNQETWLATYSDVYPTDFVNNYTLEKVRREWELTLQDRNPSVCWFVAEDGDEVVGYAGAGRIPDSGIDYGSELYSIFVAPGHQNQGIGAKLVGEMIRFLQGLNVNTMMVWIPAVNPFRRFYEKNGGQLLDHEMEIDYGGKTVEVIAFGWKNLDELAKL